MKRLIALLAAFAIFAGACASKDPVVEALERAPGKNAALVQFRNSADIAGLKAFAEATVPDIRKVWETYAYGKELNPPSFTLEIIEYPNEVETGCSAWPKMNSGSSRAFLCNGKLYVPIGGMQLMLQKRSGEPHNDRTMFVFLAAALGQFYVDAVKDFARNVYSIEMSDLTGSNAKWFGYCIAGVLVSNSYGNDSKVTAWWWPEESYPVNEGVGRKPADCYRAFWK